MNLRKVDWRRKFDSVLVKRTVNSGTEANRSKLGSTKLQDVVRRVAKRTKETIKIDKREVCGDQSHQIIEVFTQKM